MKVSYPLVLALLGCAAAMPSGYSNDNNGGSNNAQQPFQGSCEGDGLFYKDEDHFVNCANGVAHVQPCAPGTRNSDPSRFQGAGNYAHRDFCDVNLVDSAHSVMPVAETSNRVGYGNSGAANQGGQGANTISSNQAGYGANTMSQSASQGGYGASMMTQSASQGGYGSNMVAQAANQGGYGSNMVAQAANQGGYGSNMVAQAANQGGYGTNMVAQETSQGGYSSNMVAQASNQGGYGSNMVAQEASQGGYGSTMVAQAANQGGYGSNMMASVQNVATGYGGNMQTSSNGGNTQTAGYNNNQGQGKSSSGQSQVYQGAFQGTCQADGLYYMDERSFMVCTNGLSYRQPCAPGSMNSDPSNFNSGHSYGTRDFCDVNLVDSGFNAKQNGGTGKENRGSSLLQTYRRVMTRMMVAMKNAYMRMRQAAGSNGYGMTAMSAPPSNLHRMPAMASREYGLTSNQANQQTANQYGMTSNQANQQAASQYGMTSNQASQQAASQYGMTSNQASQQAASQYGMASNQANQQAASQYGMTSNQASQYGQSQSSSAEGGKMFRGTYQGSCSADGLYYVDEKSFMICSNGLAHKQPCAPGSVNADPSTFSSLADGYSAGPQFCTVNLQAQGKGPSNPHASSQNVHHAQPPRADGYGGGAIMQPSPSAGYGDSNVQPQRPESSNGQQQITGYGSAHAQPQGLGSSNGQQQMAGYGSAIVQPQGQIHNSQQGVMMMQGYGNPNIQSQAKPAVRMQPPPSRGYGSSNIHSQMRAMAAAQTQSRLVHRANTNMHMSGYISNQPNAGRH